MDKKETILQEIKALGFNLDYLEEEEWYHFMYEDTHLLYMPAEDDEDFLRFAVPAIFDVTDENRAMVLEIANKVNMDLKYVKAVVMNDSLWLFIEYKMMDGQALDELLEFVIRILQYCRSYFQKIISGDEDDDTSNSDETLDENAESNENQDKED